MIYVSIQGGGMVRVSIWEGRGGLCVHSGGWACSVCPSRGARSVCPPSRLGGVHMGLRNLSYSLNGLPSDLRHDGTLSPKVLIAQAQEVVDDKGCGKSRA